MGKPPADWVAKVHKVILDQKQKKLGVEWKAKKGEDTEKKDDEVKAEEEKKDDPEVKEEEVKEEVEEPEEPMPTAELTDEEKATLFKAESLKDLSPAVMSAAFASFAIPDKSEGFDEVIFEWQNETE